jgi:CheY-like chemotaxis protein
MAREPFCSGSRAPSGHVAGRMARPLHEVRIMMRADRRILLVDDHLPSLLALDELLCDCGYTTTCATDATTALRVVARLEPLLIVAEAELPDLGSSAFLRRVRALAPTCPVIITSAAAPFRILDDGCLEFIDLGSLLMQAGAAAFFAKPISIDRFLDCVARLSKDPRHRLAAAHRDRAADPFRELH